mgnify:CR=1 FL=1
MPRSFPDAVTPPGIRGGGRSRSAQTRLLALAALLLGLLGPASPAPSQEVSLEALPVLSGPTEDRFRLAQLLGRAPLDGFLIRTPSLLLEQILERRWSSAEASDSTVEETRAARNGPSLFQVTFLAPELRSAWNSDLPFSFNDGPLWAGRGWNGLLTLGARIRGGPVTLVLAPQLLHQENADFQIVPYPLDQTPPRSFFAHPFHPPPESMDHPLRFGDEAFSRLLPGQSSLTIRAGPVGAGVSTENAWWGPGIRNGILLSSQAPGVPRIFLRTDRGLPTPLGNVEAVWFLGRLDESDYFDDDPDNDTRTLNGVAVTLRTAFDEGLTLGAARTVFAPLKPGDTGLGAGLDAFRSVGRPNRDGGPEVDPGPDQILSLFARWVFPPHGFEVYGEWARFEEAGSLTDFLEFPQHSQGYTVGFQWVGRPDPRGHLRVQGEITNLEPSGTWRHKGAFSTYASRAVVQGYTHRGQVIGAGIGPGASSQWAATDYIRDGWRGGAFLGRIRWNAAAHLSGVVPYWGRSDVTLFWGFRGGVDYGGWHLDGELSHGIRMNYLFQTFEPDPVSGKAEGVDVANTSVTLTLSKQLWR